MSIDGLDLQVDNESFRRASHARRAHGTSSTGTPSSASSSKWSKTGGVGGRWARTMTSCVELQAGTPSSCRSSPSCGLLRTSAHASIGKRTQGPSNHRRTSTSVTRMTSTCHKATSKTSCALFRTRSTPAAAASSTDQKGRVPASPWGARQGPNRPGCGGEPSPRGRGPGKWTVASRRPRTD